jgi:conjugative relaxase-like TrwC/TraI family protein
MLSIKNLTSSEQGAHYYERDDYYLGDQDRSPSAWQGEGARALGLSGAVDRDAFSRLLEGQLPDGTELPRRPDQKRRPGFDLTFSAPKSVSIAGLVQGDARVIDAHEKAVATALRHLEAHASFARLKGKDGSIRAVSTRNLVVASFLHDASRDLDPQLHTHAVVLNATRTPDGSWKALTNEELLRSKMVGGAVYRAELALNLKALGYDVERTHADGRFELAGFTKEQLSGFSQRRAEIEAALKARGLESARAAEIAALDTREKKQDVDRRELRQIWMDRARSLGIDLARPPPIERHDVEPRSSAKVVGAAIEHLSERKSVFFEREIVARAAAFGLGRVGLRDIEMELRRAHRRGDLLDAANAKVSLGRRYTTRDAVAREKALVATIVLGQGQRQPILEPESLASRLEKASLTSGQKEAVALVFSTRDQVVAIQGYAGSGKTTALSAINTIAAEAGLRVKGFAVTRSAANLLLDAGIDSTTLADHLARQRPEQDVRAGRALWILDEASLLGTKDALRFLRAAEKENARVVLVGDRAQLPAIEAGKPFALMVDRGLETATMNEIKRQRDPELKAAVEATIDGDVERALASLQSSVHEIADKRARIEAVALAYLETPASARADALVLTGANADRRALNEMIRMGLEEEGALSGPEVTSRVLAKVDRTNVELRRATSYQAGEIVRFGRAYRSIGVDKGEYGEVVAIQADSNRLELRKKDGATVEFSPARASMIEVYAIEERALRAGDRVRFTRNDRRKGRTNGGEAVVLAVDPVAQRAMLDQNGHRETLDLRVDRHWDHGYVRTVYAAQGRTADRAILHIDTEDRRLNGYESWYVGISRAKDDVRIFTDDAKQLPRVLERSLAQEVALENLPPRIEPEVERSRAHEHARGLAR